MNREAVMKLYQFDTLVSLVMQKLGWTTTCGGDILDKDGMNVGWEDNDSFVLDTPLSYEDSTFTQINMWGDGTIEFQNTKGESICWSDFSCGFIQNVINQLENE